jgi:cysteine synthase A
LKLEFLNPTGSIKDRVAAEVMEYVRKVLRLPRGSYIVEATTGNTGISLAAFSAIYGYKFIAVMPESASKERELIIRHFGGEVVRVRTGASIERIIGVAREVAERVNGYFVNQFESELNVKAHVKTGREICRQFRKVEAFVAGVGTGGTLIGVARVLKEVNPDVKIYAVEPENCAVLLGKKPGRHLIEGIGEGFVPGIVKRNMNLIDGVVTVSDEEALCFAKKLARKGFFVGISSGANVAAALKVEEENVVTVLPDRADRYYSTKLFKH